MTQTDWLLTEVIENRKETPLLSNLKVAPIQEEARFDFQAGQLVRVLSSSGRESIFAIANEPEEKKFIEFLLKDQEACLPARQGSVWRDYEYLTDSTCA